MSSSNSTTDLIYGLDDKPRPARALGLASQHVLTMFGATVSVPLLLGPDMGMTPEQIGLLISAMMLSSGVATLIQATVGTRLPIVQGASFAFLGAFFAIIQQGKQKGWMPSEVMQYIGGAMLVGGAVELAAGFTGLVGRMRKVVSPVMIGPVIMLIGLALFKHGAPKAATHLPTGGLTIVLIIVFSLLLSRRSTFFRIFPVITAVFLVVLVCWVLSRANIFDAGHPSHVELSAAAASPWVRWDPREVCFPWGRPRFAVGFVFAVLAGYLASMVESFGDYYACSYLAGKAAPTPRQISRGIGCEGLGCMLASVFGGFCVTSYSENIGVVALTKVGSRQVVQIAAMLLIVLGVFGKFGALAAAIPEPVVGGLYCSLFGLIAAVGIQQLAKADLRSDRNLFIAGFSLFMGLSVPAIFDQSVAATYPPDPMLGALPSWLSEIVNAIGQTSMAVAAICGIFLDNVIPGTAKERGLIDTEDSTMLPDNPA